MGQFLFFMRRYWRKMVMRNKYRLSSSVYERETDEEQIAPRKIYFISVEGNITEKEYFRGVSQYRGKLGIAAVVDVEILDRSSQDNNSAPDAVLELLEEYIRLRGREDLKQDIPLDFIEKYGTEFIKKYFSIPDELPKKKKNEFVNDLKTVGYDIQYRKYLKKYDSELDEFCLFIDRDAETHSKESIIQIINHCKKKKYRFFMANPCFEFWLLLHLVDVENTYADKMNCIKENKKVSKQHTFVSNEVSKYARHGKKKINFKKNYLPNIKFAIRQAKQFCYSEDDLIDHIGCNLWILLDEMMNHSKL